MTSRCQWMLVVVTGSLLATTGCGEAEVRVGSKPFPENETLAEMVRHLGIHHDHSTEHVKMGSSQLVWQALENGDVDIYPDYTGTLRFETLRDVGDIDDYLARKGLKLSKPLGFENNYAFGMRRDIAKAKGITKISDLKKFPDLHYGFSREFIDREDGWGRLRERYGLPNDNVRSYEHLIAYEGLAAGKIDVMEVYTTDGKIDSYNVFLLEDDLKFFPAYQAVWVYRPSKIPEDVLADVLRLEGSLSEARMRKLNGSVVSGKQNSPEAAVSFLKEKFGYDIEPVGEAFWPDMLKWTWQHLLMVSISLTVAVFVGIPLGVWAVKSKAAEQLVLGFVAVLQTIPALAMLSFLIAAGFGIGETPAIIALFFYSLLPIVRNTHAGLKEIPNSLKESAAALGLPASARLWRVELPLASRSILAGIKIAAVLNVGFATLGAFIGAGGYGEPILTGLARNDTPMVMKGAVASLVMALLVQGLFELVERYLSPKGLRVQSEAG